MEEINTYVILDEWNNDLGSGQISVIDPSEHIYLVDIAGPGIHQIQSLDSKPVPEILLPEDQVVTREELIQSVNLPQSAEDTTDPVNLSPQQPEEPADIVQNCGFLRKPAKQQIHYLEDAVEFANRKSKKRNNDVTPPKVYRCDECEYIGPRSLHAQNHIQHKPRGTRGTRIDCDKCDYFALQNIDMKRHKASKHSEGTETFPCDSCDYVARYASLLAVHIKVKHLRKQAYSCDDCDFSTMYASAFKRHKQIHTDELGCSECSYKTNRLDNLKNHIASKHENIRFPCSYNGCTFTGASKSSVNNHFKATHQGIRFSCDFCSFSSARKQNLLEHIKAKHHEETPDKVRFAAPKPLSAFLLFSKEESRHLSKEKPWLTKAEKRKILKEKYISLAEVERSRYKELYQNSRKKVKMNNEETIPLHHLISQEEEEKELVIEMKEPVIIWDNNTLTTNLKTSSYLVPDQPKETQFSNPDDLPDATNYVYVEADGGLVRVIEETGEDEENKNTEQQSRADKPRMFSCQDCNYRAKHAHHIKLHRQSKHISEWILCHLCQYKAKRKDSLKRHILLEHENIRYECNYCDHKSTDPASLKKHIGSMHEGQLHSCPYCQAKFKHKSTRFRHINAEHTLPRHKCSQCEFTCTQRAGLKSHEKKEHLQANSSICVESNDLRTKKKKINNRPKRPSTKYLLFCRDVRPQVIKENPTWSLIQIGKELGRRWRELPNEVVKAYDESYAESLREYRELGELAKKNEESEDKLKPPISSYFIFMKEVRSEVRLDNPGIDIKQETLEIGRRWRNLSEKAKEKYRQKFRLSWRRFKIAQANIERRLDGVEELDEAAILAEQEQEPDLEQEQEQEPDLEQEQDPDLEQEQNPDLEQEQQYGNEPEFKSRIDRKQEENEKEQELEIRLDEGLEFEDKQRMVFEIAEESSTLFSENSSQEVINPEFSHSHVLMYEDALEEACKKKKIVEEKMKLVEEKIKEEVSRIDKSGTRLAGARKIIGMTTL